MENIWKRLFSEVLEVRDEVLPCSRLLNTVCQLQPKYHGALKRVQVIQIPRGSNKKKAPFLVFGGRLDLLPASYTPNWRDVWQSHHSRKDAAFIWSIFHGIVVVNTWRAKVSLNID
jgi:hypothetical protein